MSAAEIPEVVAAADVAQWAREVDVVVAGRRHSGTGSGGL